MSSSNANRFRNPPSTSSSSKPMVREEGKSRQEPYLERLHYEESPQFFLCDERPELENALEGYSRRVPQAMEMSTDACESMPLCSSSGISETTMSETVTETEYCEWVEQVSKDSSSPPAELEWSGAPLSYSFTGTADPSENNEALSKEHRHLQGELQANLQLLEEKERLIASLEARIANLQRRDEEQLTALASVRHNYRLCQSQLDNVQRFISTADTHADQDIIQKLQELNGEVYQISMTMADYVVECCARQTRRTKRDNSVVERLLTTIGPVLARQLAAAQGDEDTALLLQIAFQGYLSHLLYYIVSSWTLDQKLNTLIEGTYQRLRKAETQAISGRWRSLTRAHTLPSPISDPKTVVESAITALSDIVTIAGLVFPQHDVASKLSSEFRKKVSTIVSHAGTFVNMISGVISGDFETFVVQPGAKFDRESMMDINAGEVAPRRMGGDRTVLCVSRVGLRKRMGDKSIMLTQAQVVLKSFLG